MVPRRRSSLVWSVAILSVFLAGCGAPISERPRAPLPAPSEGWSYEVRESPNAEELAIAAAFPPGTSDELTVQNGGTAWVRDVEASVLAGESWSPVARRGGGWFVPCARGCRVRYRFMLQEAGRASGRVTVARAVGGAVESPPSIRLLRPLRAPPGTSFRFHVTTAPGDAFVSGLFRVGGATGAFVGGTRETFQLPYSAFGKLRVVEVGGGSSPVEVAILPGRVRSEAELLAWVATSAQVVASFYRRSPVGHLAVFVRPTGGEGVRFGTTIGDGGAAIAVDVGDSTAEAFRNDWILVHEMIHTALPDLEAPHHWLEEGLPTYVGPVARARAGLLSVEELWRGWVRSMENGLPREGDRGLDRTPTWGRTYWGGALFCLLADVEIRSRTKGSRSLDDALRAIVDAGGNIAAPWPIARVLEVGDAATGVPVLHELYARMATEAVPVDLAALWQRLGVSWDEAQAKVRFDDAAPLASVRRAMTEPYEGRASLPRGP